MLVLEKKINDNYSITLATEDNFRGICSFFEDDNINNNDRTNYLAPRSSLNEYKDEVVLREKLFSYSEEFFLLKKNDKIEGILTVVQPVNKLMPRKTTVAGLGFVSLPNEYMVEVIEFAKKLTPEISVGNVSKIKLVIAKDDATNEHVIKYFENSGFNSECILKNEINNQDLEIFSFIY